MNVTGMKYAVWFFVLVLLFGTQSSSLAQQAETDPCKTVPTDFRDMADFKGDVTNEIALLEQSVKELPAKRDQARKVEADLKDTQLKIDNLKKKPTLSPDENKQLESAQDLVVSLQANLGGNSEATYQRELDKKTADLKYKKQQLQCVNKAISEVSSPDQKFRLWISLTFAGLILAVIIGFYYLVNKDEKTRLAIFAGQEGLQFITLFSLVIAIILFGRSEERRV